MLNASFRHQLTNAFLQVINTIAHLINSWNDLLAHALEFVLDVL